MSQISIKNYGKCEKKMAKDCQILDLDNSPYKTKSEKIFFDIPGCTCFLLIRLTNHYDEYIDSPKLTDQKKPYEYIDPPSPLNGGSEQQKI